MKRTRAAAATLAAAISTASAAPLRVCVVGAGSIGREFALHHFGPSTNTVVSSIIDVDFEAARALAADVGSVQSGASVVGDSKYQATVSSCEGEPGQRIPDMFYGAYVRDPDGNKLCFFQFG